MKHELPDNVTAEFIIDDDDPVSFFLSYINVNTVHTCRNKVVLNPPRIFHVTLYYNN